MVAPFSQIIFAIVLFWRIRGYIQHQQTKPIVFDSVVANGNPRSFFVKAEQLFTPSLIHVHILPQPLVFLNFFKILIWAWK